MKIPRQTRNCHLLMCIAFVLTALVALTANAQTLSTNPQGKLEPQMLAPCALGLGSITQSDDCSIVPITGIACAAGGVTLNTSYLRRFLLTADHGMVNPYTVTTIDFGVEVDDPDPTNPITVNTYKIAIGAPFV